MNASDPSNPARLALRGRPRPVMRLNRRTLGVLAVVIVAVLAAGLWWAFRKPTTRIVGSESAMTAERVPRAEGFNALPKDYGSVKAPVLGPPLGELGRATLSAENAGGASTSGFRPDPDEEAARAERLREASEANDARKASVFYSLRARVLPAEAAASRPAVTETADYALAATPTRASDSGDQAQKEGFAKGRAESLLKTVATLQGPRSPYVLLPGTIIPAALWTGINSDLPGEIIATVTENVFDSIAGRYLLVPQGSRLIGEYDSQIAFGQRRVLLVWTELLLPDGASLELDRLPATDAAGIAGVSDGVDAHWGRLFAAAAVSSVIDTSAELAIPQGTGQATVVLAGRESLSDTVNQVGQVLTRRNLDIPPTLTVRPGFPVRALVRRELVLRPYPKATGVPP